MLRIKPLIKFIAVIGLALTLITLFGCAFIEVDGEGTYYSDAEPDFTSASIAPITSTPIPTVSDSALFAASSPVPTAAPTPQTAILGFAGDLLLMTGQIATAYNSQTEEYDFTDSFSPMRPLFESVDMMLINFEGTLAGKAAGYTEHRPTAPPATEEVPHPARPMQRFNAPDSVVANLMELGVDGFTTANNHCLDMGVDGVLRTLAVMDSLGAFHTGTYKDQNDASSADIACINGINVGFVSCTHSVNHLDGYLSSEQSSYMVNRLYNDSMIEAAIRRCREQGAEIVVALPHWGLEYTLSPTSTQHNYAQKLAKWGADIIIGSHPHVIQPIEWMEVERDNEVVSVPIVYSLGNFVSNINRSHAGVDIGLFVSIELTRKENGVVTITGLYYAPLYDIVHYVSDGRYLHEVVPCLTDMGGIITVDGITNGLLSGISRAFALCNDVIGDSVMLWESRFFSHKSGL